MRMLRSAAAALIAAAVLIFLSLWREVGPATAIPPLELQSLPTDKLATGVQISHGTSLEDSSDPDVVFLTVQTGATPTWCRMLLSAHLSGNVSVVNLAWNHKYSHIKRPRWILDFVDSTKLRDDQIVFFGDGGDTIFSGLPPRHIGNTFRRLTNDRDVPSEYSRVLSGEMLPPLMFNAEANCYHQQTFQGSWGVKKGKCLSAYKRHNPSINSSYRYLNAGAWIGRVWAVRKVFTEVRRRIEKDPSLWCDQSVIGGVYLSGMFNGVLGLDHFNKIFLPTYHLRPEKDLCPLLPDAEEDSPNLVMCHSGNVPSFIHFNGKSEGSFTAQVIRRTSWWRSAPADRHLAVSSALDGVTFLNDFQHASKIRAVCPHLSFP